MTSKITREGDDLVLRVGDDEYSRFNARTRRTRHRYAQIMCNQASAVLNPDARLLLLGTGIGGMAVELADRTGCRIMAVDVDADLCNVVRDLNIPRTVVIDQDARAFVASIQSPKVFDAILVDIFSGSRMPSFVMEDEFLQHLKRLSRGIISFNTIGDPGDYYIQRRMESVLGPMSRWTGSRFERCNIVLTRTSESPSPPGLHAST